MLFKEADMSAFARRSSLQSAPGTRFNYADGPANILSGILRDLLGDSLYYSYLFRELFVKTGMRHTWIQCDAAGNMVLSSYGYATVRDWARLGLLYLHDGIWNKERILADGWVKWSTHPVAASELNIRGSYGALFWLNRDDPSRLVLRPYPDVPPDCFYCGGYRGQYIWIIPSRELVVVRLGFETGDPLDANLLLSSLIRALAGT
jgi:CubicO group peptidase (beta-lactamase class C family)